MPENLSVDDRSEASHTSSEDARRTAGRLRLLRSTRNNLIASGIVGFLTAISLDAGLTFQMWYFAMAAYWPALLMIWWFHRRNLSKLDLFIARWGFLISFFAAPFLAGEFWRLYGGNAPLRDWFLSPVQSIHGLAALMDASSGVLT